MLTRPVLQYGLTMQQWVKILITHPDGLDADGDYFDVHPGRHVSSLKSEYTNDLQHFIETIYSVNIIFMIYYGFKRIHMPFVLLVYKVALLELHCCFFGTQLAI